MEVSRRIGITKNMDRKFRTIYIMPFKLCPIIFSPLSLFYPGSFP